MYAIRSYYAFVTMFIGVFLGFIGVYMAYEAVAGIIDYEPSPMSWMAFGVAVFSILVKERNNFV